MLRAKILALTFAALAPAVAVSAPPPCPAPDPVDVLAEACIDAADVVTVGDSACTPFEDALAVQLDARPAVEAFVCSEPNVQAVSTAESFDEPLGCSTARAAGAEGHLYLCSPDRWPSAGPPDDPDRQRDRHRATSSERTAFALNGSGAATGRFSGADC